MTRILIIGQNGQVTTHLQRYLKGDYSLLVASRDQLDLLNLQKIQSVLKEFKPDVIINPAAYTAVDLAEQEQEQANIINHLAVAQIAAYCAETNTPLIHYSTDYVFDGSANKPYQENDKAAPTGVYGETKLAGEQAIIESAAPAIILRTSWVYSQHGKNFFKTMLGLAEKLTELNVVSDQFGAPTSALSIAQATDKLLQCILIQQEIKLEQIGVYHFSCGGETSWFEFAKAIFSKHNLTHMQVNPIPTKDYPTPAKRPAYSVLDNAKLHQKFDIRLPNWEDALDETIAEST